ncbi:MAG: tetratricopeptide repeat protein [Armatimonadota bacterium]
MATCPNCGRTAEDGANFCSHCGASLRSQTMDRMIQDARREVENSPDDASKRFNLALACKLGGMHDLALAEFSRVAELQPDYGDAYYEIGLLHARAGRTEDARAALREALEVEPDHARARKLLDRLEQTRTR